MGFALAVFDDGAGPALYVGGTVGVIGCRRSERNIARWACPDQLECDDKHKVKWRKVSPGPHEVCVVGCPKHCFIAPQKTSKRQKPA